MRQLPLGVRLRERATFASFHAGPNRAVVDALERLAASPPAGLQFLCGAAGGGKTHLLQAVFAHAGHDGTTAYLPLAELAPLGPEAIEGYGSARLICVDDLDRVVGQRPWEQALFALHRTAEERGAALLWSAREPPQGLSFALPDLASRCAAGLVHRLRPLSEADVRAALKLRAALRGLELPDETAGYLLRRQPRSLAHLCQLLDTLDVASLEAQRRLTVPFIRTLLGAAQN